MQSAPPPHYPTLYRLVISRGSPKTTAQTLELDQKSINGGTWRTYGRPRDLHAIVCIINLLYQQGHSTDCVNRSATGMSPSFEPFSYDFDSYASTLGDLGLPYSFDEPSGGSPFQESDNRPPAQTNKGQEPLSLNATSCTCTVHDSDGRDVRVSAKAKLNGSFFFGDVGDMLGPPPQLTCYRRNFFGISGSINFPRAPRQIVDANGQETAISGAEVRVSAFESTKKKATELVHVPFRAIGSDIQVTEENHLVIPIISETSPRQDIPNTTFPFEWKRLQFRKATANSKCHHNSPMLHMLTFINSDGSRRGVQQYFHVKVSFIVTLETGVTTTVAEVESGPVVVRGRNPGNFIHEQTSTSTASHSLQQNDIYNQKNRTNNYLPTPARRKSTFKQDEHANSELNSMNLISSTHDFSTIESTALDIDETHNWLGFDLEEQNVRNFGTNALSKRSPPTAFAPTHSYPSSYPPPSLHIPHQSETMRANPFPTHAARHDTDRLSTSAGTTTTPLMPYQGSLPQSIPPVAIEEKPDTTESSEPLYEYFPLGLDGWMQPVDAVYRPHVAHNSVLVPELKGLMIK